MFSLRDTLAHRQVPPKYNSTMGIMVLCGRRPASITRLRSSPSPESVVVHFKSLVAITSTVSDFINAQLIAMQRLFAEGDVAVLPGTIEDLSANTILQPLQNFNVGPCQKGQQLTQDQKDLFANRSNVGSNELVVYIVSTLIQAGAMGNPVGCAVHPDDQPGVVVVQINARWLVAHEVGHALGLNHVCQFPVPGRPPPASPCVAGTGQSDRLMFPTVGWTNVPPDLTAAEYSTMRDSDLTHSG